MRYNSTAPTHPVAAQAATKSSARAPSSRRSPGCDRLKCATAIGKDNSPAMLSSDAAGDATEFPHVWCEPGWYTPGWYAPGNCHAEKVRLALITVFMMLPSHFLTSFAAVLRRLRLKANLLMASSSRPCKSCEISCCFPSTASGHWLAVLWRLAGPRWRPVSLIASFSAPAVQWQIRSPCCVWLYACIRVSPCHCIPPILFSGCRHHASDIKNVG